MIYQHVPLLIGDPCHNNGVCYPASTAGELSCYCLPGFTGHFCETNLDDCSTSPCGIHGNVTFDFSTTSLFKTQLAKNMCIGK